MHCLFWRNVLSLWKVPSDYLSPPANCVWLSLEQGATDMSWAPLSTTIPDFAICRGETLPVLILFKFGLSTSLGWKDRVDHELSNAGFMEVLQLTGVLKAIFSSRNLQNYHDMFNLLHLVRLWCSVTHTFFLSYGKLTVTLEDMAN